VLAEPADRASGRWHPHHAGARLGSRRDACLPRAAGLWLASSGCLRQSETGCRSMVQSAPAASNPLSGERSVRTHSRAAGPCGARSFGRGTSVSASARSTRFGRRVPARLRLTRFVLEVCSDGERFLAKLPARDACARGVVLNGLIVSVVPTALLAACIRFRTPAIWPDFKARQTDKDSVMVLIAKKKSHESSSAYGPRYSTRSPHGR